MGPAARSSVQQCVGEEAGRLLEHQGYYCIIPVLIAIHKSNSMDHVISTKGSIQALFPQAFEVRRRRSTASLAIPQEA